MPRRAYKSKAPRRTRGRKLQQVVPYAGQRNAALAGMAANVAGRVVRHYANQWVAQRNRDVQFKNAKAKAFNSKNYKPTSVATAVGKQSSELTQQKHKFSMPRAQRYVNLKQLLKLSTGYTIWRYQNVGPHDRAATTGGERGALFLGQMYTDTNTLTRSFIASVNNRSSYVDNVSTFTGTPLYIRCPYHLYCLNSTGFSDSTIKGTGFQPFISLSDGSISFDALGVCNNSTIGNTVLGWQTERTNQSELNMPDLVKYIRNNWYDITLGLRNATTQSTYFDIWVFQFKDGYLDPLEVPSSAEELKDRKSFYQSLSGAGYNHPIVKRPGLKQPMSKVKMLRSQRIYMDKQSTDDHDQSPDLKTVRIFIRDGKLYDYQYADQPAGSLDTANIDMFINGNNFWKVQGTRTDNATQEYPKARARVWLMIRAYDPRATGFSDWGEDAGLNTTQTPSYDICLRKSETLAVY